MKRLTFCSLIAVAFFLIFLSFLTSPPAGALSALTATFVDVGQGDGVWLKTPDGMDILIDGGRYRNALAYLRAHDSSDIEMIVATHPDADHIGGLVHILENLPVYQVLRDGQTHDTQTYRDFVDLIALKAIPDRYVRAPEEFVWGCCVVARVLNPVEPFAFSDLNNNSVVLKVSHGSVDFLFTGDIEMPAEEFILTRGEDLRSEVLKVSHHGSAHGSTGAFLASVQPETAVISVGRNSYGHPAPEALNRLAAVGAAVYRTDQLGSIVITSDGLSYSISTSQTATQTAYVPLIMKNYVPLPDLVPLSMRIELETGGSCSYTSTALGLRVWFKNIGETDAGPFVVDANGLHQTVTSGLAVGETSSLWFSGYQWPGENTVFVDATDLIQESNEGNNRITQLVPIPTLPATCTPTASPTPFVTGPPTSTPSSTQMPTPTSTPTPTITPQPSEGMVRINGPCSQFDAPGNDNQNLNEEWVCFTNQGQGTANMTNWSVEDEANHTYVFPSFSLPGGATVRLHTGSGTNTQTDLYWGSGSAIWNNSGDTVFLFDAGGNLVDQYSY